MKNLHWFRSSVTRALFWKVQEKLRESAVDEKGNMEKKTSGLMKERQER